MGFGALSLVTLRSLSVASKIRPRWQASKGLKGLQVRRQATASVAQAVATLVADHKEVRRPPSDPRTYRVLQLENGLQVLLASDPTASTSAAALTVQCGTFQDPLERLGLAHFHEHMLFLGTEKYPKEDEYSRYLSEHGGDSNAFTMSEYTTYYFKVGSSFLDGALDRFAEFFISPTFDPSGIEREMKAVDSESTNYSTEDGWRLLQVLKATAAEEHPFFRFDVGNLDTLGADDLPGTREQLVDWNRSHYQAGAMKLAVVGTEPLEELEEMILSRFSKVRLGQGQEPSYPSQPWTKDQVGRIVKSVPLKEARSIAAYWPLPPVDKHLFSKPELYISHMLGHEGKGSLHDVLNQFGWVDQLSAGTAQSFTDGQLFAVNITLTPEGDAHREEVLALLFEYVEQIRSAGPQEEIFKELAALQEISFCHKEDSPMPDDFAASAAMAMHRYPSKEILRGPFALDDWRADVVGEYMAQLTPENCLIFITSDGFKEESSASDAEANGWTTERWYKASFKEEPLDEQHLSEWQALLEKALQGEASGLQLPQANRFIPEDFSLRGTDGSGLELSKLPMEVLPPTPIASEDMLRLWHKMDKAFKTPREYVLAHLHTGTYLQGPEAVAMMRLFCGVVSDDLNTFAYDANVAGLGYSLEFADNLSLSVGGFSDKLPELMKVVVERIANVLEEFEATGERMKDVTSEEEMIEALGERGQELVEKLEVQRQILLQDYNNFTREEPWSVGQYYLSQLMLRKSWHLSEYIQVLENLPDLLVLSKVVRQAFSEVQVDMLVHGNATEDAAKEFAEIFCSNLKRLGAKPLPQLRQKEVTKLPLSTTVFEFDLAALNPAQENSCTQVVYQVGKTNEDLKRDACISLACHIGHVSAFQKLRTELQLGYIVQAMPAVTEDVCGFSVLVQGNREHPKDVDALIEDWLADFGKELEEMSDENFQKNIQAMVNERTQRYSRLVQETTRHWTEILPRRYNFARMAAATAALEELKKEEVLDFFNQYLVKGAPKRRKLSVRVLGTSAGEVKSEVAEPDVKLTSLEDLRRFHDDTESYPSAVFAEMPAAS